MDITAVVYGLNGAPCPRRPDVHIDEDAELAQPKPGPIRKPHQADLPTGGDQHEASSSYSCSISTNATGIGTKSTNNKHESYDLAGSFFLVTGEGETLNLPIPSNSRNDPLNWSRWKTGGAMFALGFYSAVAIMMVQGQTLMLDHILAEFTEERRQPWSVETLVTVPTLFIGIGTFLWVPLSLALGRRPVFLLAALLELFAIVGAGESQSFRLLLGFNCLMGLCAGLSLSLALLMVIDMTFIARRPIAIAALWSVVAFFGTGSLFLVPYLSEDGTKWRLLYLRVCPLAVIALLLAFFLYPETYFKRPTVAFDGMILIQSATEKLTIYDDLEMYSDIYRDLPEIDANKRNSLNCLGLGRSPCASWKAMGRCYLQILCCAVNPLVIWVIIAGSFNFAGMVFIAATFPTILSAPPYELSSTEIPTVNVTSGAGGLLGYCITGYAFGKVLNSLSKRNRGIREAEHYLVGYIVPVLAGCASTLLYGLAVHYKWHFIMYHVAHGLNGLSWVTLCIGNTLWVTEAFPRWAAPALTVVSGGCYFVSFSMTFAFDPWIASHGHLLVGIELTILQFVGGLIAVPIAFWGKSVRQKIHGRWANERSGALRPL